MIVFGCRWSFNTPNGAYKLNTARYGHPKIIIHCLIKAPIMKFSAYCPRYVIILYITKY